ncbi:MAG: hypothetical protein LBQ67_00470 [Treponema sp.]|jgi:hypothetical protein|nr:hypothetical protein [Treponema sp.]
MARRDYIPSNSAEFDRFFKFMNQYVAQKCDGQTPEWTHILAPARTAMADAYTAWYTAYSQTIGPHTPVETEAKNDAKKAAEQVIRPFVQQYLMFPPVTNEDRTAMGLHNPDLVKTPVPKPVNQAEADLTFPGIHLVELQKIRPVSGAVPDRRSDYGVRIHYGILDAATAKGRITAAPQTGDDLPHSVFTRRKKHRFNFDGSSGKTVYFCLRYENGKGGEEGQGPFGPILSAVIP